MLSIENPLDPSCSCHDKTLKADGSAALQGEPLDLVKPPGPCEENEPPNFSIRDYVLSARNKDIKSSWPFPQHVLHLCFKHGIKEPLPPFEPPGLVRDHSCKKGVKSVCANTRLDCEKDVVVTNLLNKADANSCDLLESSINENLHFASLNRPCIELFDREDQNLCSTSKSSGWNEACGEGVSALTHHVETDCGFLPTDRLTSSLQEANNTSEPLEKFEVSEPSHLLNNSASLCGQSDKKCQVLGKLGCASESSRTEEILSSTSALLEPMASKVCPVCKIFSSTSNTTLNAHIDQCLAVESTCKQVLTDTAKYKVKLRKKRLMVDIYATATRCTLEDLDRRNGTNWALESNSTMIHGYTYGESKRQHIDKLHATVDEDGEREVYVDSNGTKLRILSKFNDAVVPTTRDNFVPKVKSKWTKEREALLPGKKKRFGRKSSKHLKCKPQSKISRSLRLCKGMIPNALEEDFHMSNKEKEKSLSQLLKAQNSIRSSGSGTLRQWACSKRSGLSKKFSNKDVHGCGGGQSCSDGGGLPAFGNSSKRNHILKFSRLPGNPPTSLRSNRLKIPSNMSDNDERMFTRSSKYNHNHLTEETAAGADGCVQKLGKPSGSPSPVCKRVKTNTGAYQASSPKLPELVHLSLKTKKGPPPPPRKDLLLGKLSSSLELSQNVEDRNNFHVNKFQERAVAEVGEQVSRSFSDVEEGFTRAHDAKTCSSDLKNMDICHRSNESEHLSEFESETSDESLGRSIGLESDQISENVSTSEHDDTDYSDGLYSPFEYCSPNMVIRHSEKDGSFYQCYEFKDQDSATADKVDSEHIGDGIAWSGNAQHFDGDSPAHIDAQSPLLQEDHAAVLQRDQSHADAASPRSCNDQEIFFVDGKGEKVQIETAVTGPLSEFSQTPISRVGASFLSPGETGYEIQEISSITSTGPYLPLDEHHQVGRDRSRSPVSANSGISPSPPRLDFKYSGHQCQAVELSEVHDKVCVSLSNSIAEAMTCDTAALGPVPNLPSENFEGAVKEKMHRGNLSELDAEDSVKLSNDQPCCCSQKESISHKSSVSFQNSQFVAQKGSMVKLVVPPKGRQMEASNGNISFSSSLGSKFDNMSIPSIGMVSGPILTKASPSAAVELQACRDFGLGSPSSQTLPSPSSSSPILRLMGKDLMIMSKEENESVKLQNVSSEASNNQPNSRYLSLLGYSTGNISNQDSFYFHRQGPDDSFIICSDPYYVGNFGGLRSCGNYKVAEETPLQLPVNHHGMRRAGFTMSVVQQGLKDGADEQSRQKILDRKSKFSSPYDVGGSVSNLQRLKPISSTLPINPAKELIIIEDTADIGPGSSSMDTKYNAASRGNQLYLTGYPLPISSLDSRSMQPYSYFPTPGISRETPMDPNPSFSMPCPAANLSSSRPESSAAEASAFPSPSSSILPIQQVM